MLLTISGSAVALPPKTAEVLTLAILELSTDAVNTVLWAIPELARARDVHQPGRKAPRVTLRRLCGRYEKAIPIAQ
jgi:hypothetical protein